MKRINIKGQKFGRLTVLEYTHSNNDNKACWDCVCDCGKKINTSGKSLRTGKTKSCGCLALEIRIEANRTHGDCSRKTGKTKEYTIWRGIKDRCLNPKNKNYKNYGGRGIKIDASWIDDYGAFLKDMGRAPKGSPTIDRINTLGNYEASNCRWATWKEQQNNRTNNKLISFNGKTMNASDWSSVTGIKYGTIIMRLHRGWSNEKTLTNGTK